MQIRHVQVFIEAKRVARLAPDRAPAREPNRPRIDFVGGLIDLELDESFRVLAVAVEANPLDDQLIRADFDDHAGLQLHRRLDFDEGAGRRAHVGQREAVGGLLDLGVESGDGLVKYDDVVCRVSPDFAELIRNLVAHFGYRVDRLDQ